MIVRTAMVVDMGDGRKEYVDSKVYNAIMHEGYMQGRADAINDCLRIVHDVYFGNEYCVSGYYDGLECNGAECDGCLYAIIQKNIIEQMKEQKNE